MTKGAAESKSGALCEHRLRRKGTSVKKATSKGAESADELESMDSFAPCVSSEG